MTRALRIALAGIGPGRCRILLVWCLLVAGPIGCDTSYTQRQTIDLRPRILEVQDHHGGNRRVCTVHEGIWYQAFGPTLEIIDGRDGLRISDIREGAWGDVAVISDLSVAADGHLYVVHAFDRVIKYDLTRPRRPVAVETRTAEDLGIRPLLVGEGDGRVWISGRGGATPFAGGPVLLAEEGRDEYVGRVVDATDGAVATVGRRIHRVEDGTYLGAASRLRRLPPEVSDRVDPEHAYAFILRGTRASTVGILGPEWRERDSQVFDVPIWSVRVFDGRLWAVMPEEIVSWPIQDGGFLGPPRFIAVKGARDLALVEPNKFAVGGTFGRALYRDKADSTGDADTFYAVTREPGHIEAAASDGRRVLTRGPEGNWMYRIGGRSELSDRPLRKNAAPTTSLTLSWCDADIAEDGTSVTIEPLSGEPMVWSPPHGGNVYTLATASDHLWVGHDEGVDLFRMGQTGVESGGRILMEGPVIWLFNPRVGDEIAFVSAFGGLGSAEIVPDPQADPNLLRRVDAEDRERVEKQMREQRSR